MSTNRGRTGIGTNDGSFAPAGTGTDPSAAARYTANDPAAGRWAPTAREDRAMLLAEAGFPVHLRGTTEDREAFARHLASRLPQRSPSEIAETDRLRTEAGLPPSDGLPIVVVPPQVTVQELGGTAEHPGMIAAANGGVLCMDLGDTTASHQALVDEAKRTGVARPPGSQPSSFSSQAQTPARVNRALAFATRHPVTGGAGRPPRPERQSDST